MTQTRYTLQQHHVNLKSSVKLSHVKRDRDNFISAINFYRFEKMIYYW